jgi:phage baseplate assembly protein V
MREVAELMRRVAELERRMANTMRDGTVEQVDAATKRVRLRIGGTDDQPFLSPWVPYAQHAGALKIHTPPSVGQQMTLFSPAGDLRSGRAMPFTWSDTEASPSDDPEQHVLTFGDLRAELTSDGLLLQVGESQIEIQAAKILLKGPSIVTDGETRLDNGNRAVVFVGSLDDRGDTNTEGSDRVFV